MILIIRLPVNFLVSTHNNMLLYDLQLIIISGRFVLIYIYLCYNYANILK